MSSERKIWAALSYLWLLSILVLIFKKGDSFVAFHAKQGLVLFLISVVLTLVPAPFWLLGIFWQLLQVGVIILLIWGILKALSGEQYKLPLVGDLAAKINL